MRGRWCQLIRLLFAGTVALHASCVTLAPRPTEVDVLRASARWSETTLASLERGRTLYLSRCTNCHRPVEPRSISAETWPKHVGEMRKRARLVDEEVDLIARYLITMSTAAEKGS